jgi:peptidoglycan/LPS O-acetylase OafA/YrhL
MGAAMQLYAGFALVVIAIVAIIAIAALASNLIGAVRRRLGRARTPAHDDFSAPARRARIGARASQPDVAPAGDKSRVESSRDDPSASR